MWEGIKEKEHPKLKAGTRIEEIGRGVSQTKFIPWGEFYWTLSGFINIFPFFYDFFFYGKNTGDGNTERQVR